MRRAFTTLLILIAACSSGEVGTDAPDSEGWVVRNAPPYPVAQLSPEPLLRIGALEGTAAVEFSDLIHVGLLEDGRIVVVDRGPNEVRWFDETGDVQYEAGGRGEGPGEFMFPVSATQVHGDTLVVFDGRTQRLTVFDPSGSLVSTRGFQVTSGFNVTLGTTGAGRLLAVEHRATFAMAGEEYNAARDSLVLMVPSMSAEGVDTIATLPGPQSVTWVDYDGDRPVATRQMELPLGEVALAAPVADGVAVVPPGEPDLFFYSLSGQVTGRAVRSEWEPTEVSRAIEEQFIARELEATGGGPPPGVVRRDLEARFALLADDPTVPPFDRILAAAEGRSVWLRQTVLPEDEAEPSLWTWYDREGSVRAQARIPPGFHPTYVGVDRIAGIETDRLGVEYATVYGVRIR